MNITSNSNDIIRNSLDLDMHTLSRIDDFMNDVIDNDTDVILSSKQFLKR